MKVAVYLISLAVVLFTANAAEAKDKKSKSSNVVAVSLTKGQEKEFFVFIEENFHPFSLQTEWKIMAEIVTLYNESSSKFLNTNKQTQQEFNEAVEKWNAEAAKNPEAAQWMANLAKTTKAMNFFWKMDWDNLVPQDKTNEEIGEPISSLNGF